MLRRDPLARHPSDVVRAPRLDGRETRSLPSLIQYPVILGQVVTGAAFVALAFLLAFFASIPMAQGQYATGGTSEYLDQLLWFTWGGGSNGTDNVVLSEGATSVSTYTFLDGRELEVVATLQNVSHTGGEPADQVLRSYRPGNYMYDGLDKLFHTGGLGTANQLVNGISRSRGLTQFTVRVEAYLDGAPYPLWGLVMADAESLSVDNGDSALNEHIQGRGAGEWYVFQMKTALIAGSYWTQKTNYTDETQSLRFGPGTDQGTAAVAFLLMNNPTPVITADIEIQGGAAGGITAVAFGVLAPHADFGDAPSSYGEAMHLIQELSFSDDSIPADGVPMNLNTSAYTPAKLLPPSSNYLGTLGPDAEGTSTEVFITDEYNGILWSGEEENAWGEGYLVLSAGSIFERGFSCAGTGKVAGWIDFNGDGTFEESERAEGGCSLGTAILSWAVPADVQAGVSYVRLRYATNEDELILPVGVAGDGEVEDSYFYLDVISLAIVKETEVIGPVDEGDIIPYTFKITNTGEVAVENIVVTDPTLGGVIPNTSLATGSSWPGVPGQLDPDQSVILVGEYTVTPADIAAGGVVNIVNVTGNAADFPPISPIASNMVYIESAAPAFTLAKVLASINGDSGLEEYATVGDELAYTVTVENTGNVTLEDIAVDDPLTGFKSTIASLVPGEVQIYATTYTITQADLDAGSVTNTATAGGEASSVTTPADQQPGGRFPRRLFRSTATPGWKNTLRLGMSWPIRLRLRTRAT